MNRVPRLVLATVACLSLAGYLVVMTGCEVDSASGTERSVGVNYSGFYTASSGRIVANNTGARISSLDLRQAGDSLEAIDNNGLIFRGTIGDVAEAGGSLIASFSMEGNTTAGQRGTFSGTLSTSGGSNSTGSTQGSMQGTWVEPSLFSTFSATATIPGQIDTGGGGDGDGDSLSVSPSSITVATGGSATFTAANASGSVTWTLSGGTGSINPTTGTSTTYTRTTAGSETLTARDSDGNTASASIN